jgi:electron transfer flavoprotein beta subunit
LAAALRSEGFDLVWAGKQAVDDDQAQVGALVATLLGLPQITVVIRVTVDAETGMVRAERELEGAIEVVECRLPCVLTAQRGLNQPRYPTLPNIMKARKKEIKSVTLEQLGVAVEPLVEIVSLDLPPSRPRGKVLTGDPREAVRELVRLLHDEAKVL